MSQFKSGGRIRYIIYPENESSLRNIVRELEILSIKYIVVGNCSNILVKDSGYKGAFICLTRMNRCVRIEEGIYAEAGCMLSKILFLAKEEGLTGLEEMVGIPGTIGGAVAMNAGAFNREICDVIDYMDCLYNGKFEKMSCSDLQYSYRHSKILTDNIIVLGCMLKLRQDNKLAVQARMNKFMDMRKKTQPNQASLGSVFKKVNGVSAGYYIEKAGLKGERIGNAMISNKHANFIINLGGAKSKDFIDLSKLVISTVDNIFHVSLKYEILLI